MRPGSLSEEVTGEVGLMGPLLNHNDAAATRIIKPCRKRFVEESDHVFALDLALRHFGVLQVVRDDEIAALARCGAAQRSREHVAARHIHELGLLVLIASQCEIPPPSIPMRSDDCAAIHRVLHAQGCAVGCAEPARRRLIDPHPSRPQHGREETFS
jgi:hypothetical protein